MKRSHVFWPLVFDIDFRDVEVKEGTEGLKGILEYRWKYQGIQCAVKPGICEIIHFISP